MDQISMKGFGRIYKGFNDRVPSSKEALVESTGDSTHEHSQTKQKLTKLGKKPHITIFIE